MYGGHLVRSWSKTQGGIALSSGEAELTGIVKTTAEVIGMAALMEDLGAYCEERAYVYADASAALGVIERRGVGNIRHLDTRLLWIQERRLREQIDFLKIGGLDNPADMGTKHLDVGSIRKHLETWSLRILRGRPPVAHGATIWGAQACDDELTTTFGEQDAPKRHRGAH